MFQKKIKGNRKENNRVLFSSGETKEFHSEELAFEQKIE